MPNPVPVMPKKKWIRYRKWIIVGLVLMLFLSTILFHTNKKLPEGISYESDWYPAQNLEFLYNISYDNDGKREFEDQIYQAWYQAIEEAERFIVFDMFMFTTFHNQGQSFPALSEQIVNRLISQMERYPQLKVILITDEINTTYGSHPSPELERLKQAGAQIVMSDLDKLRDSNPLYSGMWRMFFQWFGQKGPGWIKNPFSDMAPKVTVRSYLKLLNVKANHRKVLITEKTGIIASANVHDASAYHSNIAFRFSGDILREVWRAEQAVIRMSGGTELSIDENEFSIEAKQSDTNDEAAVRVLTEGRIGQRVIEAIEQAEPTNRLWIGMFYLADRSIVRALLEASERGTDVRLILDPNDNAFGQQKSGLPNKPVAAELKQRSGESIDIRWFNADQDQYHTKLLLLEGEKNSVVIGGSANFTRRNVDDLNLETNLMVSAPTDSMFIEEVKSYFERLWSNQDGEYTLPYETKAEKLPFLKQTVYTIQNILGFTTF
ncbi:phospholipase D family protein [Paenibacillus abyssi]|uniref:phospholipase D n=1 Tax=Paenibacillus abyssi TaxID=1340531 RepID=A0A917D534_9BACL|nr:phospholipase D family protein [Paenibacillus abyssi]GGG13246.1 phospholipase D [Paenibacillus abyssi]